MNSATIIADASHCGQTGAAGWAGWIKSDGRKSILRSGPIKSKAANAMEAELLAIANSLHVALQESYIASGSLVMIQSDSMAALGIVRQAIPGVSDRRHAAGLPVARRRKQVLSDLSIKARDFIAALVADNQLVVSVRHVKGHTEGGGRQWVNRACDAAARKEMRQARRVALMSTAS
jgi:ribonuclease HI